MPNTNPLLAQTALPAFSEIRAEHVEPAIDALVAEFTEQSGLTVELELALPGSAPAPSHEVALCVYRVVQEALHNVTRHAQAMSVRVAVRRSRSSTRRRNRSPPRSSTW